LVEIDLFYIIAPKKVLRNLLVPEMNVLLKDLMANNLLKTNAIFADVLPEVIGFESAVDLSK